jgi:hypothetical protein
VTKEPLPRQRPRPAAAEGEQVQGALADALAPAPGREFVESVDDEGDEAEEAVDEDDQMVLQISTILSATCSGVRWSVSISQ